jgi:hypothetical protein
MRFAEINNNTNTIIRELNLYSPPPSHKFGPDKETRIIPIIILSQPEFNSETETIISGDRVIYLDRVEQTWLIKPIPIPLQVPLWAFRAILTIQQLAPSVEALINQLPEPQKTVASIQWVYGNFIERNHPLIDSLGTDLGLTKEEIDNVFVEANKLK